MVKISVIMVCRANICRSPMAEAMLRHRIHELGLDKKIKVDSAGTRASQPGHKPDLRAQRVMAESGIGMAKIKARQISLKDVQRNDYIIAMDTSNYEDLLTLCPDDVRPKISMLMNYSGNPCGKYVPDPYFGAIAGFEEVYRLLDDAISGFLEQTINSVV